jgi:hypothetical protein
MADLVLRMRWSGCESGSTVSLGYVNANPSTALVIVWAILGGYEAGMMSTGNFSNTFKKTSQIPINRKPMREKALRYIHPSMAATFLWHVFRSHRADAVTNGYVAPGMIGGTFTAYQGSRTASLQSVAAVQTLCHSYCVLRHRCSSRASTARSDLTCSNAPDWGLAPLRILIILECT